MTQKWLLPVDGSDASLNAVRRAIEEARRYDPPPALLLLNVQPPLSRDITRFVNGDTVREFHQEKGDEAMAGARQVLEASSMRHETRIAIGEPAQTIAETAASEACTRIVMGSRGWGSVMGLLMGSVTSKVVHLSPVPVLLVK